jgi:hypothetical protein
MKTRQTLIQVWLLCAAMPPAMMQAQFSYTNSNDAVTIISYNGLPWAVTITNGWRAKNIP